MEEGGNGPNPEVPAVNQHYPTPIEANDKLCRAALVERMDASIGEATSAMGAMITELLRRTLRGGVSRIGEQLDGFVAEKVDETIAERTPAIEHAAAEIAENTARAAATEVAKEEIVVLENKTRETSQQLQQRIEQAAQSCHQATVEAARQLACQIEEAEKRVEAAAQAKLTQELQDLVARSRKGTLKLETRLTSLETLTEGLEKRHAAEERRNQELTQRLQQSEIQQRLALKELQERNQALHERLAELEKPSGIRAFFSRAFGRGKPEEKPSTKTSDEKPTTP
jgi:hypothetical protein